MKNLLLACFSLLAFSAAAQPWKMPARQISLQVSNATTTVQEAFDSGALGSGSVLFDPTSWNSVLSPVDTNFVNPFVFYLPGTNITGLSYAGGNWALNIFGAYYSNGVWTNLLYGSRIKGALFLNNEWRLPDYRPVQFQSEGNLAPVANTLYTFTNYFGIPSQSSYSYYGGMNTNGIYTTPDAGVYTFQFRVFANLSQVGTTNDAFFLWRRAVVPNDYDETAVVATMISSSTATNTFSASFQESVFYPANSQISFRYSRPNIARTSTNFAATANLTVFYHGGGTAEF